ncbi:hypothetical protein Poli38472_013292 [Pythium oligandrum]|uniref:Uncharacterized protein n=1 Tax=Pythium oligandrum TaxID=41045 RepID=A0A8K1C2R8_PYTOL|nr:hypothetical protein Poli38472_013292 [Pythium oligandrum]|eukprot:TMW55401.1 hypothetical protein Poli38472_013292 [Pythium oligandrum]
MPLQELTRELVEEIARQYPTLQRLNLARNALRELRWLELLPHLRRLDVSENLLRTLAFETEPWGHALEFLDLTGNELESLQPLSVCRSLVTLRLGRNRIQLISELKHLQTLEHLQELVLEGNPIASHPMYRREIITMLPGLNSLDDRPVTPAERLYAKLKLKPVLVDGAIHDNDSASVSEFSSSTIAAPELDLSNISPNMSPILSPLSSPAAPPRTRLLTPASINHYQPLPTQSRSTRFEPAISFDVEEEEAVSVHHVEPKVLQQRLKEIVVASEPVSLLQSRVDALEAILSIQDKTMQQELTKFGKLSDLGADTEAVEKGVRLYTNLLATWRTKVMSLMVQLKTMELQQKKEDDTQTKHENEQALVLLREELTAQTEVWRQKAIDLGAQRDLERVRVQEAKQQSAMATSKVVKVVRTLATERERLQRVAEEVALFSARDGLMTSQMDAMLGATTRLHAFERRLHFLTERLQLASHLVAHREAKLRNSEAALDAERRIWQHQLKQLKGNTSSGALSSSRLKSRSPGDSRMLHPMTEMACRALFHRLDPYETGLVRSQTLLQALKRDLAVRDAVGDENKHNELVEHVEEGLRRRSPSGTVRGNVTWGELLLVFMPEASSTELQAPEPVVDAGVFIVPPAFDAVEAGHEVVTRQQRRMTKQEKRALETLSREELITQLLALRSDRAQLQTRVIQDAHCLQRRARQIQSEWKQKVDELVTVNNETHHKTTEQTKRIESLEQQLQEAERTAGEAQYQLQALRRQLCEQQTEFQSKLEAMEAQRVASVAHETQIWQQEIQDMGFQQSQLRADNTKLELTVRQLEREVAKYRDKQERQESAQVLHLEDKVRKRDAEIAKLRRERNTILNTLREQEQKLAVQSTATEDAGTQTTPLEPTTLRSIGSQTTDPPAPRRDPPSVSRLGELPRRAIPSTDASTSRSSALSPRSLRKRLEQLESLSASLLAEDE